MGALKNYLMTVEEDIAEFLRLRLEGCGELGHDDPHYLHDKRVLTDFLSALRCGALGADHDEEESTTCKDVNEDVICDECGTVLCRSCGVALVACACEPDINF